MQRHELGMAIAGVAGAALSSVWHSKIAMATLIITLLDLFTGVLKAWVLHDVASNPLGKGATKICIYLLIITGLTNISGIVV